MPQGVVGWLTGRRRLLKAVVCYPKRDPSCQGEQMDHPELLHPANAEELANIAEEAGAEVRPVLCAAPVTAAAGNWAR